LGELFGRTVDTGARVAFYRLRLAIQLQLPTNATWQTSATARHRPLRSNSTTRCARRTLRPPTPTTRLQRHLYAPHSSLRSGMALQLYGWACCGPRGRERCVGSGLCAAAAHAAPAVRSRTMAKTGRGWWRTMADRAARDYLHLPLPLPPSPSPACRHTAIFTTSLRTTVVRIDTRTAA